MNNSLCRFCKDEKEHDRAMRQAEVEQDNPRYRAWEQRTKANMYKYVDFGSLAGLVPLGDHGQPDPL